MKIITFVFILFLVFEYILCSWQEDADEACQRSDETRHADTTGPIMKAQCVVKCVKYGERSTFVKLLDGHECELIGFNKGLGKCLDGQCQ
jgi:hypothetical protein